MEATKGVNAARSRAAKPKPMEESRWLSAASIQIGKITIQSIFVYWVIHVYTDYATMAQNASPRSNCATQRPIAWMGPMKEWDVPKSYASIVLFVPTSVTMLLMGWFAAAHLTCIYRYEFPASINKRLLL